MRIEFDERFELPAGELFSYFATPADWPRLYGLAAEVRDLGGGWCAVPLASFPFPLVARNTVVEPTRLVRWEFRGFWRGGGEVTFESSAGAVSLTGHEEISVRWLGPLSRLLEKLFLERRFRAIWALGWRRLRRQEQAAREPASVSPRHEARSQTSSTAT